MLEMHKDDEEEEKAAQSDGYQMSRILHPASLCHTTSLFCFFLPNGSFAVPMCVCERTEKGVLKKKGDTLSTFKYFGLYAPMNGA